MDRARLFEWLLKNECPFEWNIDQDSIDEWTNTCTIIFYEEEDWNE